MTWQFHIKKWFLSNNFSTRNSILFKNRERISHIFLDRHYTEEKQQTFRFLDLWEKQLSIIFEHLYFLSLYMAYESYN